MKYLNGSYLDHQFLLPKSAKEACNIQKIVIFVNIISDIKSAMIIIQA